MTGLDSKSSSEHNMAESLEVIRPTSLTKDPNVPQPQFTSHPSLSPSGARKFELDRKQPHDRLKGGTYKRPIVMWQGRKTKDKSPNHRHSTGTTKQDALSPRTQQLLDKENSSKK